MLHITQSFAVVEVLHAAAGLVRSPIFTAAQQVASRLFIVWGILWLVPEAASKSLVLFRCAHMLPWHANDPLAQCTWSQNQ